MHSLRRDIPRTSLFPNFSPAARLALEGWKNEQSEGMGKDGSRGNLHQTCPRLHFSSFGTKSSAADAQSRKGSSSQGKEGLWEVPVTSRYSLDSSNCLFWEGSLFAHSISQTGVQALAQHRQRWLPPAGTRVSSDEKNAFNRLSLTLLS